MVGGADPWRAAKGAIVSRCRSARAAHRYKYLYFFALVEVKHLLLVRQRWCYLDLLLLFLWFFWLFNFLLKGSRRPICELLGFRSLMFAPISCNNRSCGRHVAFCLELDLFRVQVLERNKMK